MKRFEVKTKSGVVLVFEAEHVYLLGDGGLHLANGEKENTVFVFAASPGSWEYFRELKNER